MCGAWRRLTCRPGSSCRWRSSRWRCAAGLILGLVVYSSVGGVVLHRLDALQRGLLALVGLARRDHLAVAGDEVEVKLAACALFQHELTRHVVSPAKCVAALEAARRLMSGQKGCRDDYVPRRH